MCSSPRQLTRKLVQEAEDHVLYLKNFILGLFFTLQEKEGNLQLFSKCYSMIDKTISSTE
jgi:hypothetical protein